MKRVVLCFAFAADVAMGCTSPVVAFPNQCTDAFSAVLRPQVNDIEEPSADMIWSVSAGQPNEILGRGFLRSIFGGYDNRIWESSASDIFGSKHTEIIGGSHATVVGGSRHEYLDGDYGGIYGGKLNTYGGGNNSAMIGGQQSSSHGSYNALIATDRSNVLSGRNVMLGARQSHVSGGNFMFMGPCDQCSMEPPADSRHSVMLAGLGNEIVSAYGLIGTAMESGVYARHAGVLSGRYGEARGRYSLVLNGRYAGATGDYSVAGGNSVTAGGMGAISFGISCDAPSYAETCFGSYPVPYVPQSTTEWHGDDRAFVIGAGRKSKAPRNVLEIRKNGLVIFDRASFPMVDPGVDGALWLDGDMVRMSFGSTP